MANEVEKADTTNGNEALSVSSPGELRIEVVHPGEIVEYATKEAVDAPIAR